jgi:hypothetical protein
MYSIVHGQRIRHLRYQRTKILICEEHSKGTRVTACQETFMPLLREAVKARDQVAVMYISASDEDILKPGVTPKANGSIEISDIVAGWVHGYIDLFDNAGMGVQVTKLPNERPFLSELHANAFWIVVFKGETMSVQGVFADEVEVILKQPQFVGAHS